MSFIDIVTDVVDTLRRPDITEFINRRARQQVKYLHGLDNYPRDLQEKILDVVYQPSYRLPLPDRFRRFSQIIPLDAEGSRIKLQTDSLERFGFRECDPRYVVGFHKIPDTNVWYVAGDLVNILSNCNYNKLLIRYYSFPNTTPDNFTTWIIEDYPELVSYRVLAVCYRMLGNADQARIYDALYQEVVDQFLHNALNQGV